MRVATWLSSLLFAVVVLAADPPKELQIETTYLPDDCPVKAQKGDAIKVHYTGTLFSTGAKFDSSYDRNAPLPLTLGVGQVIKGWDQGLVGMCLNEKRTLTIPSRLAYGSRDFGSAIPPNSVLVFDVELVSLESKASSETDSKASSQTKSKATSSKTENKATSSKTESKASSQTESTTSSQTESATSSQADSTTSSQADSKATNHEEL
ncbi:hypothetical protein C8R44DRAFT_675585 [Mycena epipterygia]|nr:hypothetical protein C8R44DRAFT_675585 [Mycena epipterygia]